LETQVTYTLAGVAQETGLPIPKVRYYASLYGELLGATRTARGDWSFSDEHLPFFRALAKGVPPAAALSETGLAGAKPANGRRDESLDDRLEELFLQLQDLCEETKQVQILLSRIIGMLESRPAPGEPARQAATTPQAAPATAARINGAGPIPRTGSTPGTATPLIQEETPAKSRPPIPAPGAPARFSSPAIAVQEPPPQPGGWRSWEPRAL